MRRLYLSPLQINVLRRYVGGGGKSPQVEEFISSGLIVPTHTKYKAWTITPLGQFQLDEWDRLAPK